MKNVFRLVVPMGAVVCALLLMISQSAALGTESDEAARSAQTIIDFDDLPHDTVVTTQYAEAAFSSSSGYEIRTKAQDGGTSPPNFICTAEVGRYLTCYEPVYVDFTPPPLACFPSALWASAWMTWPPR